MLRLRFLPTALLFVLAHYFSVSASGRAASTAMYSRAASSGKLCIIVFCFHPVTIPRPRIVLRGVIRYCISCTGWVRMSRRCSKPGVEPGRRPAPAEQDWRFPDCHAGSEGQLLREFRGRQSPLQRLLPAGIHTLHRNQLPHSPRAQGQSRSAAFPWEAMVRFASHLRIRKYFRR